MKGHVSYNWRLREVIADKACSPRPSWCPYCGTAASICQPRCWSTAWSPAPPERLSFQVLSALCDILVCARADLITTSTQNDGVRKVASGTSRR